MRLKKTRSSQNVRVRGASNGAKTSGLGVVGLLVVLAIGYFTGIDVMPLIAEQNASPQNQSRSVSVQDDQTIQFVAKVLATTEDVWSVKFPQEVAQQYRPPQLVIFSGVTQSACGGASGATGPFYCPADRMAYLDTQFFQQLERQRGAGGDFAAAYVIAHHVQNEIGILGQVDQQRRQSNQMQVNALSVRLELQADCLSGVGAQAVRGLMERGDLSEALNAALKIGDDHLQRQAGQVPQPHTFTHGTSEQRARWFERGYDSGKMASCDTFRTRAL